MKLTITLVIIGVVLIIDGTIRMFMGIIGGGSPLIFGGLVTGWLLGGYILYRGIRRYGRIKSEKAAASNITAGNP